MSQSPLESSRPQMATVVAMESHIADSSPGVCVPDEEYESNDYFKLGTFKVNKRKCWVLGVVAVALAAGAVLTAVVLKSNETGSSAETGASGLQQSEEYYQERFAVLRPAAGRLSSPSVLVQSETAQSQALDWMVYRDTTLSHKQLDATQFAQRYAMLVLFYACGGEEWQGFVDSIDQQGDIATCQWEGTDFLKCNADNEISELNLKYRRVVGQLPAEMKHLTSLQTLELSDNFIEGSLPEGMFDEMTDVGT
jgi:hypothetical protein